MKNHVRTVTATAMVAAMAYAAVCFGRVPVVLFLKYDPKDILITLGGVLLGPMAVLRTSVAVSLLEMLTISDTGPLGCFMNILSTCSFALPAAFLSRRSRSRRGLVLGLLAGGGRRHAPRHAVMECSHHPYLYGVSTGGGAPASSPRLSAL